MTNGPTRTLDDDDNFAQEVKTELHRARAKFPDSVCSLAALMEEVGELANALIEYQFALKKGVADPALWGEVIRKEAVQVAVMAQRVATEGDRSLVAIQSSSSAFPLAPRS